MSSWTKYLSIAPAHSNNEYDGINNTYDSTSHAYSSLKSCKLTISISITDVICVKKLKKSYAEHCYSRQRPLIIPYVFVAVKVLQELDLAQSTFRKDIFFEYPADLSISSWQ